MKLTKTLAVALEGVGCSGIMAGIVIEAVMKADLGFIAITSGSLAIALGALIFGKLTRGKL